MNIPAFVKFSKIGALRPDHSSPFDETANGFVMGAGCGILVLKRLSDAVKDGDRVHALIRGSAVNHDGHRNGLTAPHGPSQEALGKRHADVADADAEHNSEVDAVS